MDKRICRVRLLDLPFQVDKPFDYFLPFFDENTKPGALVAVPFGGGNNTKIAAARDTLHSRSIRLWHTDSGSLSREGTT